MKTPLILMTNDDGIRSPGLHAAVEAIEPLGEIIVVAPTHQQTSMARSFHGQPDEYLRETDMKANGKRIAAYHCDCSPAQAILHSMKAVFHSTKPDLLVSGINYGENLGSNITISGTVGAAIQASSMGIPSLALSLETDMRYHFVYGDLDWSAARRFARLFAEIVLRITLPSDVDLLNVNIPSCATASTPWKTTSLSRLSYFQSRLDSPEPTSRLGDSVVTIDVDEKSLEPGSDIHAIVKDRVVSVTPVSIDMTSRVSLDALTTILASQAATAQPPA